MKSPTSENTQNRLFLLVSFLDKKVFIKRHKRLYVYVYKQERTMDLFDEQYNNHFHNTYIYRFTVLQLILVLSGE